jgi:hypothetical protein
VTDLVGGGLVGSGCGVLHVQTIRASVYVVKGQSA